MKKNFIIIIILSMLSIFTILKSAHTSDDGDYIGRFVSLSGNINYDSKGISDYILMSCNDAMNIKFENNDKIITFADTTGEITTTYGANLKVAPNSEFQLGFTNIRINQGGTWISFKPKKMNPKGKYVFVVDTPVGTVGIKGTTFAVLFDKNTNNLSIQVSEGVVAFESLNKNIQKTINAGEFMVVESSGEKLKGPEKYNEGFDILAPNSPDARSGGNNKEKEDKEQSGGVNPWKTINKK